MNCVGHDREQPRVMLWDVWCAQGVELCLS